MILACYLSLSPMLLLLHRRISIHMDYNLKQRQSPHIINLVPLCFSSLSRTRLSLSLSLSLHSEKPLFWPSRTWSIWWSHPQAYVGGGGLGSLQRMTNKVIDNIINLSAISSILNLIIKPCRNHPVVDYGTLDFRVAFISFLSILLSHTTFLEATPR